MPTNIFWKSNNFGFKKPLEAFLLSEIFRVKENPRAKNSSTLIVFFIQPASLPGEGFFLRKEKKRESCVV